MSSVEEIRSRHRAPTPGPHTDAVVKLWVDVEHLLVVVDQLTAELDGAVAAAVDMTAGYYHPHRTQPRADRQRNHHTPGGTA